MKRINVAGWLFVVLVTLLVEAGVRAFDYETSIATPSSTLQALVDELWSGGALSDEIGQTLSAYLQGLALAIVIGVAAGLLIGSSRILLDATSVVIEFLRPIPGIALIPLAILLFGLGVPTVRFVVAYAAAWPILINTLYGVRGVDRMLHDVARSSGVGRTGRLFRVTLPAALPSIATGIRVSAAIALLVCVTAEFVIGAGGIGSYMDRQQIANRLPEMYAAVVLVGLIGYLVNVGLRVLQRRDALLVGRGAIDTVRTSRRRRLAGTALGMLVFLAALARLGDLGRCRGLFSRADGERGGGKGLGIWPTSEFLSDAGASLKRLAVGFGSPPQSASAWGSWSARHRARRTLEPFLELLRAVPAIAIVPAAIVILGLGDAQRIAVIAFGLCFPILVNTAEGVRLIPPEVRDTASMLHVGRVERIFRIYFPAALPSIMAGLRIAVSIGLILVVVSEFVGEGNGLGHYLSSSSQRSRFRRCTPASSSSASSATS